MQYNILRRREGCNNMLYGAERKTTILFYNILCLNSSIFRKYFPHFFGDRKYQNSEIAQ